jgi:glutamine synthetase
VTAPTVNSYRRFADAGFWAPVFADWGFQNRTTAGKTVARILSTLGEALDALEADQIVKAALPGEMYRVFSHYKRDEWERFIATISDWDIRSTWTSSLKLPPAD